MASFVVARSPWKQFFLDTLVTAKKKHSINVLFGTFSVMKIYRKYEVHLQGIFLGLRGAGLAPLNLEMAP